VDDISSRDQDVVLAYSYCIQNTLQTTPGTLFMGLEFTLEVRCWQIASDTKKAKKNY